MKLSWIGGPSFVLELGSYRLLCDPVLGDGEAIFNFPDDNGPPVPRLVALPEVALDDIDGVVVSRNRSDHFDRVAAERLDPSVPLLVPAEGADRLTAAGFSSVKPAAWWEETIDEQRDEKLAVTAVPTHQPDPPGGSGASNGYVLRHEGGDSTTTVYWSGDTLWFSDARRIKDKFGTIDVFVPHLGAVPGEGREGCSTLNGKEAMQFVFMFQPKRIVPIGYNTFGHYREGIEDFEQRIGLTMYEKRLVVLNEGDTFER